MSEYKHTTNWKEQNYLKAQYHIPEVLSQRLFRSYSDPQHAIFDLESSLHIATKPRLKKKTRLPVTGTDIANVLIDYITLSGEQGFTKPLALDKRHRDIEYKVARLAGIYHTLDARVEPQKPTATKRLNLSQIDMLSAVGYFSNEYNVDTETVIRVIDTFNNPHTAILDYELLVQQAELASKMTGIKHSDQDLLELLLEFRTRIDEDVKANIPLFDLSSTNALEGRYRDNPFFCSEAENTEPRRFTRKKVELKNLKPY